MRTNRGDRQMQSIKKLERELLQPLRHFRDAVTAAAEREMQASSRPVLLDRNALRPSWIRHAAAISWAPALLLFLLTIGLAMTTRLHHSASVAHVQAPQAAQVTQVARGDDAGLLTEIDQDLSQDVPTPLAPLEMTSTSTTHETNQ